MPVNDKDLTLTDPSARRRLARLTLATLFARAGITRNDHALWFPGVRIVGNSLCVSDADCAKTVERCFLARLRAHWPDLDVKYLPVSAPAKEPRSVFKGQSPEPVKQKMW